MPGRTLQPIPTYFSHSYWSDDCEINEFFLGLFWKQNFRLTVDPKSDILSIPYLELMMKRSACYTAVVTHRTKEEPYFCSPFILLEYGLAVQAQKPRLLFVEEGVSGNLFEDGPMIYTFSRNREHREANRRHFARAIADLAAKSRPYSNAGVQLRKKVGVLVPTAGAAGEAYSTLGPRIRDQLWQDGYSPVDVDLKFEEPLRFLLDLDQLDFIVVEVGSPDLPPWVYAFIHGRFVPSIKLCHVPESTSMTTPVDALISGKLASKVARSGEPVIYWSDGEDLEVKLDRHLMKFRDARTPFATLEDGLRYFRGLGRPDGRIFVSNAGDANVFSASLSRAFSAEGIDHFHYVYRNTMEIGEKWATQLAPRVDESTIFVALLSEGYAKSKWCMSELRRAEQLRRDGKITIIPYFLESVREPSISAHGRTLVGRPVERQVETIVSDMDNLLRGKSVTETLQTE